MLLTLIFASLGVAYAIVTVVAAVSGATGWADQWWIPAVIISFECVGAVLTRHYRDAPPKPYRDGTGWSGDLLGNSNASLGVLVGVGIVLVALCAGAVPVWLVARASAKRDGINLGFLAAFQFRVSRATPLQVSSHAGTKHRTNRTR
jgi:hypothetical protein